MGKVWPLYVEMGSISWLLGLGTLANFVPSFKDLKRELDGRPSSRAYVGASADEVSIMNTHLGCLNKAADTAQTLTEQSSPPLTSMTFAPNPPPAAPEAEGGAEAKLTLLTTSK